MSDSPCLTNEGLAYLGARSLNQYAAVTPPSTRKSLPVMNAPSGTLSSAPTVPTSSGIPARPAAYTSSIRLYPGLLGPFSSSLASEVMMMPGLMVLTLAARFPQRTASAIRVQAKQLC